MAARVVPTLRLAVLCEDIEFDGSGRPALLAFPVHTLRFPPGVAERYRPPLLKLYLQLQGGVGTFYVSGVLREQGEVVEVYRTPRPVELVFEGDAHRIVPLDLVIELNGLTFPKPGAYELLVYANYANLHDPTGHIPHAFPPVRVTVLRPDGSEGGAL